MDLIKITIVIAAIALIVGAVMLIKHSAKKFHLSDEQLERVKKRQQDQANKDKEE
jgi:hypothetical protein